MDTQTYWDTSASLPHFGTLSHDLETEVVIIGGGLTGITAAHLLKEAGVKIVLLERQRCAGADTGRTTAHLTAITDERLHRLVKFWGCDGAKAFWDAGFAAIDQISEIVRINQIVCDFEWVPGYLHASLERDDNQDRESLQKDAQLARELGFEAEFVEVVPYAQRPGVRFAHQAKFHPLKYLAGLLPSISGDGSYVFENTEASQIDSDPLTVHAGGYKIRCRYLILATHNPLMGMNNLIRATLFQSKLALYTSYVVGARLSRHAGDALGAPSLPEALFWDTTEPYYYLRVDRHADHDYLIFGGQDCKTGQEQDSRKRFGELEQQLKKLLPAAEMQHRWMGQVIETNDGLPLIGESAEQQFVGTGFCGNGFTLGTLAAMMARDRYLERQNPWFDLFAVTRKKFHGGAWRYLTENLDYPYYLIRDRFRAAEEGSLNDLKMGEGKILRVDGKKTAAYRDESGKVSLLSPVCTHLKCIVRWNAADKTWDCPCHGSRFKPTGEVFSGPAEAPLEKLLLSELGKAA